MLKAGVNQYIRSIELIRNDDIKEQYPFSLKAIGELEKLDMHPNVTFIVGENGSGKSTLLEAIAIAYGFNLEGGSKNFNFSTTNTHSVLHKYIRIIKGSKKAQDGYFFRAESFYNVASNIEELDKESSGGVSIFDSYGGRSLHEQSHGESFISLLMNRFGGNGLYILDEPEAALSPTTQMMLVSRIHKLVQNDSQFIIATHSPIIMSYPNATIYCIDNNYLRVKYEDTEHYQVMKNFLNNTEHMLNILMKN